MFFKRYQSTTIDGKDLKMHRNTHSWCWGYCLSWAAALGWTAPLASAAMPAPAAKIRMDEGIVGRPGEWIFYPDLARSRAVDAVRQLGAPGVPVSSNGLVLVRDGDDSFLVPLDLNEDGEVGSWELSCETQQDEVIGSDFESEVFEGEDGLVLLATVTKTLHVSLLSADADRLQVLSLRLNLVFDVDSSVDGYGSDEVDLIFPIESYTDPRLAKDQFDGLVHALAGGVKDCHPAEYCGPVLHETVVPDVKRLDCDSDLTPGLACYCACWSNWRTNMAQANDQLAACIIGLLGLKVLGQIGCGIACLASLPGGPAVGPICAGCLTGLYTLVGGGIATCLATYGAYRLIQFHQRRQCLARCRGPVWEFPKWTPPVFDVPSLQAY